MNFSTVILGETIRIPENVEARQDTTAEEIFRR